MFEFTSFSVKNPQKLKCGDSSYSGTLVISGESCPLLIVADGVSRAPKDWLASKSAVSFIVQSLSDGEPELPKSLQDAVDFANQKIIEGIDDTLGMLTTVTVLIYQPSSEKVFWVNIGDSRLYGLKGNKWEQLSSDDSKSQPYMVNGNMRLRNGQPIMVSALTKAVGYTDNLDVEVKQIHSKQFNGFLLCSDGFYELSDYDSIAFELYKSTDYSRESERIQSKIHSQITDDASLALLGIVNERIDIEAILQNPVERLTSTPAFAVKEMLDEALVNAIRDNADEVLSQLLEFMGSNHIFLDRKRMIQILEMMISHNSLHLDKITAIIKRAPIQ